MKPEIATCETTAAISLHARIVTAEHPIKLGGHHNGPSTLCGRSVGWDTQRPVSSVSCRDCVQKLKEMM
jgi:hypothetical protein